MKKLLFVIFCLLWLETAVLAQSYPSPTYNNATINGTATIPHAAITGGTISGTPISGSTGSFTTVNSSGLATLNGLTTTNAPTFGAPVPITSGGTGATTATGTGSVVLATSPTLATPNIGAASASTLAASTSVSTPSLQTNLMGWPGLSGTYWQSQFHANWNVVQSQIANNPTEWQIYTNAAQGIAQTQSGTNQLVLQSGTNFNSAWVGFPYLYCDGTRYKVATFTDTSHITVQTPIGGAVSFGSTANCTYYFVATTTTSTVNVSGTAVTYVSGQPFVSIFDNGQVYINGTAYNATYNSPTSITLGTNLGTLTGATLNQYANINNELATLRLQGLIGVNEQNGAITFRPDGLWIQTLYAGQGKYSPMFLSVGENPAGTISPLISMYPSATIGNPGQLSLGGTGANQSVQINQNSTNVNYAMFSGAATGVGPSLAWRGADATVSGNYDVQGANNHNFTSHNFANNEFQIFGNGGTSWLAVGSSSSSVPTVSANGPGSNLSVGLYAKGTGTVQILNGAGLQLQVSTVSALPSCVAGLAGTLRAVSDATAPTYNGSLTGGGGVSVPVFCNGSVWTSH
ncbi:hypothetical protein [Burkholderia lata]|uniref:hypothetical protein n=1 Tax=Burkholderia lata (strain ATCC 17760 / DSM 23089 / LMG 22485 / NCIMB 9086 / R18194 / 383) TaxID=482957 RepID=UPI00145315D4|nr:hypothetical protein [Burkholderia lata]VWB67493.1 putative phage lipoprotein [Burkholderia lata]